MKEPTDASETPSLPDRRSMPAQSSDPDRQAPPYGRLRQAPWSAALTSEFGVSSARAFVDLVNEARRQEGRFPVPQGSFPTNERSLDRLIREMREARARAGSLKAAE